MAMKTPGYVGAVVGVIALISVAVYAGVGPWLRRGRIAMSLVLRLPTGIERKLELLWRGSPDTGRGARFLDAGGGGRTDPGSVRVLVVFKNPVTMFIGGVAAVILELAEPRVRTGVWEHSRFSRDPVGRLRRTGGPR